MKKRILFAVTLFATYVAFALPHGYRAVVSDPRTFLEVLAQREPHSQKIIYTYGWPAPVEVIGSWSAAGYEVRMILPENTSSDLLYLLDQYGVHYRLFPAGSNPNLDSNGVAAAAVRTIMQYLSGGRWLILSRTTYAGYFSTLDYVWNVLSDEAKRSSLPAVR